VSSPSRRGAVLIIRVWFEGDPPSELRARVVEVVDPPINERTVATVATAGDLNDAVRSWIETLAPQ
jgi:hypothetical protein